MGEAARESRSPKVARTDQAVIDRAKESKRRNKNLAPCTENDEDKAEQCSTAGDRGLQEE